jgi:hypothetical protein
MGLEGMGAIGHMALWTLVIWLLAMGIDNWQLITVTNVLLQSSKLELLHKLFFKIPWVVVCCKSTAFIPKLLFQCQLFPMHFLLNVANHFHVFLSFTTPYFLSSTPSSSPFTTILVFVEIIKKLLFISKLMQA